MNSETEVAGADVTPDAGISGTPHTPPSAPRHCPNCRLFSPPDSTRCDCGFDFSSATVDPAQATSPPGPAGVGGWLALLAGGMLVIAPAATLGQVASGTTMAEVEYPLVRLVPEWTTYKVASWFAAAVFASTSAYAGWGLARGRTWSAVRRATIALWVIGPGAVLVFGILIPWATIGGAETFAGSGGDAQVTRSAVVALAWTAYLRTSRRVRATYLRLPLD